MMGTSAKVIRGVAIFDLVATLGMTLPGLSGLWLGMFRYLHVTLGLSGDFPSFAPANELFVNIAGILVFFFSLIRIRTPTRFPTLCDCGARILVASLILIYTFSGGMSRVFLPFVATELGGLMLNLWALREVRD